MELRISSEHEMEKLGGKIASILHVNDLIYLIGELGAGKTTLVRGIVRGRGFQGRVSSPTFTLMNVYPADVEMYHFDFYRLSSSDFTDLGLEDYLEKNGISMIEWPELGMNYLPEEALVIQIDLVDDDYDRERKVVITGRGDTYQKKIKELTRLCEYWR